MASAPTYDQIAWTSLGTSAATITLSSIPSTYTDLVIVLTGKTGGADSPRLYFNSDTASNYSSRTLYGNGSSAGSQSFQNATNGFLINSQDVFNSTNPATVTVNIQNYAGSTYKTSLCQVAGDNNGSGATGASVGLWRSTAAINSITFRTSNGQSYSTGTTVAIYGIKAA